MKILMLILTFCVVCFNVGVQAQNDTSESDVDFWTCSMHPQIRLPSPGKCPICAMNLIAHHENSLGENSNLQKEDASSLVLSDMAEKLAEIQTSPVVRKSVLKEVRLVGVLDYNETQVSDITAWVAGRIDRMFVDYTGIKVIKGDHMVELYSPDLIGAQEELLQAAKSLQRIQSSGSSLIRSSTERVLVAAREKLILLGLTEQQVRDIEKGGKVNDKITIYAPSTGVVVEKKVNEGMYVQTGMRIYSIADLSTLWLKLDAYESDLPWIRYGQDVEFSTQALPGKVFHGKVSFISPVVNQSTRTTQVRVNVDNKKGDLKPGLFVSAIVRANVYGQGNVVDVSLRDKYICPMHPEVVLDKKGVCPICDMQLKSTEELGYITDEAKVSIPLVIPVSAPLLTGKRAVVYVKDKEHSTYTMREVVLGPRSEQYYIVEKGLSEGELVVTNGAFKIDADLQIRGEESMMNPQEGTAPMQHHHGSM